MIRTVLIAPIVGDINVGGSTLPGPPHKMRSLSLPDGSTMQCIQAQQVFTGCGSRGPSYLAFEGDRIVGLFDAPRGEVVAECAVLTPTLIDAHSHIGIHRFGEPAAESESNESLDSILPLPDVLDSINMDDPAFAHSVAWGTVYSCVLPGSANLLSGLSAVVRHVAPDSTAALIARAGIKAALGYNPIAAQSRKGARPTTRMGAVSLLRGKLRNLKFKLERPARRGGKAGRAGAGVPDDLSAEDRILSDVLRGRVRLRVHAHKIDDIAALLRLVDEFGLRVSVEHAISVDRPEIFRELRRRRIPVVYGPVETSAGKVELRPKDWRNARHLLESGVEFGLMTDHPVTPSWALLQQSRSLLRCGLSKARALETVTRINAALVGVDDRLGTLERGKWASFVGWNGDPFDLASHPVAVYAEGVRVFG